MISPKVESRTDTDDSRKLDVEQLCMRGCHAFAGVSDKLGYLIAQSFLVLLQLVFIGFSIGHVNSWIFRQI